MAGCWGKTWGSGSVGELRSLVRPTVGELRKLANLSTLLLLVVFVAVLWQDAGRMTGFASIQAGTAVGVEHENLAAQAAACASAARSADPSACEFARGDVQANREFAPNAVALGRIAEALGTLPGLITYVGHQAASGLGWLLLALSAALHLGRERSSRSIDASLLQTTRSRYLVAKAASLWLAAGTAVVAAVLTLWVARPTFVRPVRVPAPGEPDRNGASSIRLRPDPTWASWRHALVTVLAVLVVLALVTLVFTALASLAPDPVSAGAVLGAIVIGLHLLQRWWDLGRWLPERAVSAFVGMTTGPYAVRDVRLWDEAGRPATIYVAAHAPEVVGASIVIWLLVWAGATSLAWLGFTRRWPG